MAVHGFLYQCALQFVLTTVSEGLLILTLAVCVGGEGSEQVCLHSVQCKIQAHNTFYWQRSIYNFDITKNFESDLRKWLYKKFFSIHQQWLQYLKLTENSGKVSQRLLFNLSFFHKTHSFYKIGFPNVFLTLSCPEFPHYSVFSKFICYLDLILDSVLASIIPAHSYFFWQNKKTIVSNISKESRWLCHS